jgi:hypothetical protein
MIRILALYLSVLALMSGASQSFSSTLEGEIESESIISKHVDREGIRDTLFLESDEVSKCYGGVLKKAPGLKGKLRFSWDIDEKGRALNVKQTAGTIYNEEIVKCIAGVLERAEFPQALPGETVKVEFPFVFKL